MTFTKTLAQVRSALRAAWRRLSGGWWPLLQQTAAAAIAWIIAEHVIDHHEPFFAPIAAVVSLNASFGERGANAIRLLAGVLIGIGVGEVTIILFGEGYGRLALAVLVAMAIARAIGGARVTVAQAAAGAILTVAVNDAESGGVDRFIDALIGAGVALVFTQFLFSPEPIEFLRRAESRALTGIADGLLLMARALAEDDEQAAGRSVDQLREVRDDLVELARVRRASTRMARHSLIWRWRTAPVVRERENAGNLDLLANSCLMLIRASADSATWIRRMLGPHLADLGDVVADLAADPGGHETRQRAVDRTLTVARGLVVDQSHEDRLRGHDERERDEAALTASVLLTRIVAVDLLDFAGVESAAAAAAVHRATGRQPPVDKPPSAGRTLGGLVSGVPQAISVAVARIGASLAGSRRKPGSAP